MDGIWKELRSAFQFLCVQPNGHPGNFIHDDSGVGPRLHVLSAISILVTEYTHAVSCTISRRFRCDQSGDKLRPYLCSVTLLTLGPRKVQSSAWPQCSTCRQGKASGCKHWESACLCSQKYDISSASLHFFPRSFHDAAPWLRFLLSAAPRATATALMQHASVARSWRLTKLNADVFLVMQA